MHYIIKGGDVNAYNPAWGDVRLDNRGIKFFEFLVANNLMILNSEESPATFLGP